MKDYKHIGVRPKNIITARRIVTEIVTLVFSLAAAVSLVIVFGVIGGK